ncbi:MAG TPA: hypothetical protein VMT01_01050 [Candidatus Acidoferrum sp.]|jgi:hypothetical protein|nr:hypothetical protein [Candidatus Acidoferrum sp.]
METLAGKEAVEKLKTQWKRLWHDHIDDKMRAEGIASADYSMLFIEKGMIIFATRNFRMLNFKEILEQHKVAEAERFVSPAPSVGGWGKFTRTFVTSRKLHDRVRRSVQYEPEKKQRQQPKKGGRGWLHC